MEWYFTLLIILTGLVVIFLTGMPVAFSFMLINIIVSVILYGSLSPIQQLITIMSMSASSFQYVSIPLYTFMGLIIFYTGLASKAIDAADPFIGKVHAKIAYLAVIAGTVIGTMIGAATAASAILASTLLPEMLRRGYKKPMSIGPILGSGGLAMIIPPSGLAIILASMMQVSIGEFFIACLLPGILMAINYSLYIYLRCRFQPDLAPTYEMPKVAPAKMVKDFMVYILPLSIIIFCVLGFIFLGIATPSESAASGSAAALLLAAAHRKLSWNVVKKSMRESTKIAVVVLTIIVGASAFSGLLAYSGAIKGLTSWIVALPVSSLVIQIAMLMLVIFLGMWMNGASIVMITAPIFLPILQVLGVDILFFCIPILICVQIGTTSPPFGSSVFVVQALCPKDIKLEDLYRAGLPFIACDIVSITIIMCFPIIGTWLPSMMGM